MSTDGPDRQEEWTMETNDVTVPVEVGTTSRGGRHPVNLTHLIMGVAFAAFALIWVAVTAEWLPVDDLRWVLPLPWLLAGSAGLLAATLGGRRSERGPEPGGDVGVVGDHRVDPRP